jgi:hypothetical protein
MNKSVSRLVKVRLERSPEQSTPIQWPDGKSFAFTIFDDTDLASVSQLHELYAFLDGLGMRITKSVWPIRGQGEPKVGGATCEDLEYLDWVLELQRLGFEIALHNVAPAASERAETIRGFERFRSVFGHDPATFANHVGCAEAIYWGDARLTGTNRRFYNLITRHQREKAFYGHVEGSRFFWGDICRERVRYVRNFVYDDINTLKFCPLMPYHDPDRPFVNAWFASSDGSRVDFFVEMISEINQDRLSEEGGACIMYAHLAQDFYRNGQLDERFLRLMKRLSRMNGWFVPVQALLDYLVEVKGTHQLRNLERRRLERRWLLSRIRRRGRV